MKTGEAKRLARYLALRTVVVAASLVVAVLLVIVVANLGGKVDEIVEYEARFTVNQMFLSENVRKGVENMCTQRCGSENSTCIQLCKQEWVEEQVRLEIIKKGLDKPFLIRLFYYLRDALTLSLGRAMVLSSDKGSHRVWDIIAERLPPTILLFTTANMLIFVIEILGGLTLSRKYGSLLDKVLVSLAPFSSLPGWFYGLFLIMIFSFGLRIFPSRGMVSPLPPEDTLLYAIDVLWHMALPTLSWLIAYAPIGIYYYRTYFLMFSTEEYVEYAKARGIPNRIIERRYILRPTLPPIITTLVLTIIGSWMGAIITESVFQWPGLGSVLAKAIQAPDPPVIIGIVTIYAYLLAVSVIALDLVYGIVDPRVRVGGE
ncbi:MAG: ABC transporter permease [Desulfurococcaceae archaeon]